MNMNPEQPFPGSSMPQEGPFVGGDLPPIEGMFKKAADFDDENINDTETAASEKKDKDEFLSVGLYFFEKLKGKE